MASPMDERNGTSTREVDPFRDDALPVDLLLYPRMRGLGLDPSAVAARDATGFEMLRIRCRGCDVTVRCAADFADEFADPGWQDWRNYCPNATMLSILDMLERCGAADGSAS